MSLESRYIPLAQNGATLRWRRDVAEDRIDVQRFAIEGGASALVGVRSLGVCAYKRLILPSFPATSRAINPPYQRVDYRATLLLTVAAACAARL